MRDIDEFVFFEAARSWATAIGSQRTRTLLVLDDIHWASRQTISRIAYILHSSQPANTTLICTARNTTPDQNEDLTSLIDDLARRATRSMLIHPRALDQHEISEWVTAVFAGQSVPPYLFER